MDGLTQFALGAGIGMAVLGRRMGARKAALTGGVLAILPDADLFWPYADDVDRFVTHRTLTHALPVHALVTPVFAEGLVRAAKTLKGARLQTALAVFLCLSTHALLDSLTIYGTRLFWPLWPEAVGLGSVFIIDPLYTLPLLVVTLWGLFLRGWSDRFTKALAAAFVLSTAYLGWGAAAQQMAEARATRLLTAAGVAPDRIFATPTPFNSLFWRVVAVAGPRYFNIYVPLLGDARATTAYVHPRQPAGVDCLEYNGLVTALGAFTDGFYRFEMREGALVLSDLRMGLTPNYVFRFVVAEHGSAGFMETPPRRLSVERVAPGDWAWLKAGITGWRAIRPAEAGDAVDLTAGGHASTKAPPGHPC
jgi:inner membrane protein